MGAPYYCWRVDTIGREECQDISLVPFPLRSEAFPKVNGCALDLLVGVVSACIGIPVDY